MPVLDLARLSATIDRRGFNDDAAKVYKSCSAVNTEAIDWE